MNLLKSFAIGLILLALSIVQMPAQLLFSDGFETYVGGAAALDKNLTGESSFHSLQPQFEAQIEKKY